MEFIGVRHYGSVGKLVGEIDDRVSTDTDAIFIERPEDPAGWKIQAWAFLQNPAIVVLFYLYSIIAGLFALAKNRRLDAADSLAAEQIAEDYDIEVHEVDKDIFRVINGQEWAWAPLSWLLFSATVVQVYEAWSGSVAAIGGAIFSSMFAILIVMGYPFLISTVAERNSVMLARILHISADHEYTDVCMITGGMHLSKFEELAEETGVNYTSYEVPYLLRSTWARIKDAVATVRQRASSG